MNSQRLPSPPWRPHLEDLSEGALAQVPVVDDGIAVVLQLLQLGVQLGTRPVVR